MNVSGNLSASVLFVGLLFSASPVLAGPDADFTETFSRDPASPWKWIRENKSAWRTGPQGLEVKVEPGNMWGPANDAKNILVRPAPAGTAVSGTLEITASIRNQPTGQYEQTDLVWYFDDSHMVKIGQEMVDGKLSIVMGREEKDRCTTMGIYPLKTAKVKLRLLVEGEKITGTWQADGETGWQKAGSCTAPRPMRGIAHIALMFYQGTADAPHWSRVSELKLVSAP